MNYLLITFHLGIAVSSGFASVYTEKVIKASHSKIPDKQSEVKKQGGLAYMQCQLAIVSLLILGFYALIKDYNAIINDVRHMFYIIYRTLISCLLSLLTCTCLFATIGFLPKFWCTCIH